MMNGENFIEIMWAMDVNTGELESC